MAKVLVSLPDIFVLSLDAYWTKYNFYSRSEFIREALRRYIKELEGIKNDPVNKVVPLSPYQKRAAAKRQRLYGIDTE